MASESTRQLQKFRLGLRNFFDWWQDELAGMIPPKLRRSLRWFERDNWIMELRDREIRLFRPEKHGDHPASGYFFNLDTLGGPQSSRTLVLLRGKERENSNLYLRLPAKGALRKEVTLPLAAEENLREVLGFEMDQQTPFKADQVYYDYQVMDRSTLSQRLKIRLFVIPRRVLDEILEKLSSLSLYPDIVNIMEENTAGVAAINLLPPERRRERKITLVQKLNYGLASLAAVLLITAVALPLYRKVEAMGKLEVKVAEAKKEAEAVSELRGKLDQLLQQSHFLEHAKQTNPITINLLRDLTHLLPDGTWLYQYEQNGKEVLIQGESSASSTLVGLIESSPLFRNVSYRSPVTQNQLTGKERFNLSAEVEAKS